MDQQKVAAEVMVAEEVMAVTEVAAAVAGWEAAARAGLDWAAGWAAAGSAAED